MGVREFVASNLVGYVPILKESDGNMLEWHDCKSEPPNEQGYYILAYHSVYGLSWTQAYWSKQYQMWQSLYGIYHNDDCYKWAEVELPE